MIIVWMDVLVFFSFEPYLEPMTSSVELFIEIYEHNNADIK